jgi:chromosome segregation ATPase
MHSAAVAYEVDAIADKVRLAHLELVLEERDQTISKLHGRVDSGMQTAPDARIVELEFALFELAARPSVCSVAVCTDADTEEIDSLQKQLADVKIDAKAAKQANDESYKKLETSLKDAMSKLKEARKDLKTTNAHVASLEARFKTEDPKVATLRAGVLSLKTQCEDVMKDNETLKVFIGQVKSMIGFLDDVNGLLCSFAEDDVGIEIGITFRHFGMLARGYADFMRASRV